MNSEVIKQRFDELDQQIDDPTPIVESRDKNRVEQWATSARALLEEVWGPGNQRSKDFGQLRARSKRDKMGLPCDIESKVNLFRSAKNDFDAGIYPKSNNESAHPEEPMSERPARSALRDSWMVQVAVGVLVVAITNGFTWFMASAERVLGEAEKNDIWAKLRTDEGDDGFVMAVSKHVRTELTSKIERLEGEVAKVKGEVNFIDLSRRLATLRQDTADLFVTSNNALAPLQLVLKDGRLIAELDTPQIENFIQKRRDLTTSIETYRGTN